MFRQSRFKRWNEKPLCECGHEQFCHPNFMDYCVACDCNKFKLAKTNKYNAEKVHIDGTTYDSKLEAKEAWNLEMRKKAGDIKDFRPHVVIPLTVNDYKICDYEVDFQVENNDGSTEYVEVKGMFLPLGKLKWKLFEALMSKIPNVKLRLVRQ